MFSLLPTITKNSSFLSLLFDWHSLQVKCSYFSQPICHVLKDRLSFSLFHNFNSKVFLFFFYCPLKSFSLPQAILWTFSEMLSSNLSILLSCSFEPLTHSMSPVLPFCEGHLRPINNVSNIFVPCVLEILNSNELKLYSNSDIYSYVQNVYLFNF